MNQQLVAVDKIVKQIWDTHQINCISDVLNIMEVLHNMLPHCSKECQNEIISLLGDILRAAEENDYLRLADLLEYKLKPLLDEHFSEGLYESL